MTSPIRLLPMQLIHNFNLTTNINFSLTQHIMSFLAMHFTQRVTYVLILLSTVSIFQVVLSLMSHLLFSFCSKIPLSFSANNFLASWHFQSVIHIISPSLHFTLISWSSSYHCYLCKSICSSVCTLSFFFFSASNFQLKLTYFHLRLFLTSLIIPAICLSSL